MQQDGWWWHDAALTNKSIRRRIMKEMLARRWSRRIASAPALVPGVRSS